MLQTHSFCWILICKKYNEIKSLHFGAVQTFSMCVCDYIPLSGPCRNCLEQPFKLHVQCGLCAVHMSAHLLFLFASFYFFFPPVVSLLSPLACGKILWRTVLKCDQWAEQGNDLSNDPNQGLNWDVGMGLSPPPHHLPSPIPTHPHPSQPSPKLLLLRISQLLSPRCPIPSVAGSPW